MAEHGRTLIWLSRHQVIKAEPLSGDGVCSALQGQGLTPTETLEENGLNIHCRQAACSETRAGNTRSSAAEFRRTVYAVIVQQGECAA